jgi:hypothetical protein
MEHIIACGLWLCRQAISALPDFLLQESLYKLGKMNARSINSQAVVSKSVL